MYRGLKSPLESEENMNSSYNFEIADTWDLIIDNSIATEEELQLITSINGYRMDVLNDVIEVRTGYHDIFQYLESEG